ncbi:MAG: sugar phosphate nucleotidyltransferase, partial [Patescibacteria group bacterium]
TAFFVVKLALMENLKVIIPAAGRGTRMRPVSDLVPKEMWPFRGQPLIAWAIQEAMGAGIPERDIIVVVREGKELIVNYLQDKFPKVQRVYQQHPLGLADALASCAHLVGSANFAMLIPDQFIFSTPALTQLVFAYRKKGDFGIVLSSIVKIPSQHRSLFPGTAKFSVSNLRGNVASVMGILA